MTSTTRNRYGDFSSNPAISKSDQSRAFQGGSLGQNFSASNSWDGGIWGNSAIGSVLRSGTNDSGRSQLVDTGNSDTTETFTGSGSLLPSSESDTWTRPKTTQWPSANTISPGLSNVRTSQSSTSPVRHRNGNQQGRSTSPYFSVTQSTTIGHGMSNKSAGQSYLDPTSGSFKVSNAFEPHYQGPSSRHNSDEAIRRPSNTIVFGSSDSGYPSQTARSNSNTNVGYSGYNSSVASRSGSIPPSRNGIDHQSQFGADYSSQFVSSEFVHRPMHSSRASNYSANSNHRFQNPGSSLQFGDLSASLGKLEIGREIQEPSYSPYLEHAQQAGAGNINAISAVNNNAYRSNQTSLEPDIRQGASYNQHRVQFGERSTHSPGGSEFRRSHESPLYSTTGTPPLNDHQRATSTTSLRSNTSHRQVALLEQKLRGLQQEQQSYIGPQLNIQFRNPYTNPYEYSQQNMIRMNPLAQYYPPPALGGYTATQVVSRGSIVDAAAGESLRSSLLEEFRSASKGTKRYELKDIYDHVVEFSGDQHGSRFIQQKLETANSDEKDQIFREILPNSLQLMTDVFGNYVIQKFFEHGNQSQKKILANQMKGHILDLSLQMYGCRVVQKAFEHILTDQQALLVKELEYQVLKCVKDQNGNHVVQKAIERIPAEHIQFIINAFTGQVHGLATHPYGCRVIQRMLEHCQEPARGLLLEELHCCASSLIVDQYGNYVTQHVIEHGRPEDRAKIISLITAQLLYFSKHKFASNVVEKSIQFGTDEQRQTIVRLLTALDEKGESPLQQLMRDQYGNYVIQKLLAQLKGSEYDIFVDLIRTQLQQAKRFSYGKQVGAIEKLVNGSPTTPSHTHPNASPPARLDTSTIPTPPLLTEDTQSPQTSSLPSTNTSTVDGPIGDHKPTAGISVEVMAHGSV